MATAAIGELTLEEAAREAAGNWQTFECFVWWRASELADADQWMIHYTNHRDSGLLDQSNAGQISKALEPFTEGDDPDVVMESHSHWAVGHIDGFSLRVFKNGKVTESFRTLHRVMESLADYPILDEDDYSEREYEATVENIVDAAWRLRDDYQLPDDWQYEVYSWLSEHECSEIENTDDQGVAIRPKKPCVGQWTHSSSDPMKSEWSHLQGHRQHSGVPLGKYFTSSIRSIECLSDVE